MKKKNGNETRSFAQVLQETLDRYLGNGGAG